ncbi:MarR family winged helix-turn-helix transcriptional regulator [Nakamurella leprariae]|uniref:Winged helix-turn-helix transcriptional regulator n=1 Tax=Nakamurella leprariae TaxID=2803911 RepID=A0A939BWD0_9ACTN|nr:MarR family winged helix-turn-helix transcriptional regulator [Nakamurella leprariae]MBM9467423.1 winged helix-turn-helix transcriptional regulator [Nakamurella leprariae]
MTTDAAESTQDAGVPPQPPSPATSAEPRPSAGGADLPAELADAIIGLVRQYHSLRVRINDGKDVDAPPQMAVLGRLVDLGPCRASVLAEALLSDPSTVSRQVAGLVKAGWVDRGPDPVDGRAAILSITEAGRQRWVEHWRRRGEALAPVVERWSDEDQVDLARLLRQYTLDVDRHWDEVVTAFRKPPAAGPGA